MPTEKSLIANQRLAITKTVYSQDQLAFENT